MFDVTYVQFIVDHVDVVATINSWFMAVADMCLLTDDFYRIATQGLADYFGNNIFRQIIYRTWPFSKAELTAHTAAGPHRADSPSNCLCRCEGENTLLAFFAVHKHCKNIF